MLIKKTLIFLWYSFSGQAERKKKLTLLRNKGNFFYNVKILKEGGELLVCRRPSSYVSPDNVYPCKFCLGFFVKSDMWRHAKRCLFRSNALNSNENLTDHCKMILFANTEENRLTQREFDTIIVPDMQRNDITRIVKNDELILTVGRLLLSGLGPRRSNYISQKVRLLARLVLALREEISDKTRDLISFLKPEHFDDIVDCVKKMAGYTMVSENGIEEPAFKKASLPLKIGYALESAIMLKKGMGIRNRQQNLIDDSSAFFDLFHLEWSIRLTSSAKRTLENNKFNKVIEFPVTSDLLKVKNYLEKEIKDLTDKLKENSDLDTWRKLSEVCVTRLITFNKRRSAEPTTLLIERFIERKKFATSSNDQIMQTLSPIERTLMQR